MFYIVGLGNPGEEYENTRHNVGRMAVLRLQKDLDFPDFETDKKSKSLISKGKIKKESLTLILPETFMNKSGKALSYFIKPKLKNSKKGLENLVIVYDDIDLALGDIKISYNKGVGGHKGLASVVKAVRTREFIRLRIGTSPITASGKIKKPKGEDKVIDFILGKFKPKEQDILKKIFKKSSQAVQIILTEGRAKTMNMFN